MDIFYEGTRHCKKCQRDLPNNSLYFPYDKSCKDKLRNVCRECNPKYKRFLEIGHRTNEEWSNEDLELLKSKYKCSDEFVKTVVRWSSIDLVSTYNDMSEDEIEWEEVENIKNMINKDKNKSKSE